MRFLISSILMLALCITAPALATNWDEDGDAPELPPAQATEGNGPLLTITGSLLDGDDADLYCIYIDDPSAFSATTCAHAGDLSDSRLSLFDADGYGITYNDDGCGGGFLSTITGQFVPAPGVYMLGVAEYSKMAQNAAGENIWDSSNFGDEQQPVVADALLAGWSATVNSLRTYVVTLTGASFCDGIVSVENSTWGSIKGLYR